MPSRFGPDVAPLRTLARASLRINALSAGARPDLGVRGMPKRFAQVSIALLFRRHDASPCSGARYAPMQVRSLLIA